MVVELNQKYHIEDVDLESIEKFQVEKLRPIYKLAKTDPNQAKKMTINLMFDSDGYEEQMCQSISNLSDEESLGSKERRGKNGRKSDGGIRVVYKDKEQQLIHMEIKSPSVVSEDELYHVDFVKLSNLMKDELDLIISNKCLDDIPVFGILIGGYKATVFAMDLVYTKIYRLYEIGTFLFPHNTHDLNRLDDLFDTMIKLDVLSKKSVRSCLNSFKLTTPPNSPSSRQHLRVRSFGSPQKSSPPHV
ncbi:unnamed protein product [Rhizopus stolonifer]